MFAILVFALFVVTASAHNITLLEVPVYADPRRNVTLVCHYVMAKEDPPLHSVKWYRDENEVFRYTPGEQPPTRTFKMATGSITSSDCDDERCSISVVLSARCGIRIPFACEVSTERPRFTVVKQTKTLTVAVTMQHDPVITVLAHRVTVPRGEDVLLNCSAGLAMPPANIRWYIDEKPEVCKPKEGSTYVLAANEEGLRKSWRPLRVKISATCRLLVVRCEAWQALQPPYMRSTNVSHVVGRSSNLPMSTASDNKRDILGKLLHADANFSDEQLREHIDSITIAGNDTASLVVAYVLVLLGNHKHEYNVICKNI